MPRGAQVAHARRNRAVAGGERPAGWSAGGLRGLLAVLSPATCTVLPHSVASACMASACTRACVQITFVTCDLVGRTKCQGQNLPPASLMSRRCSLPADWWCPGLAACLFPNFVVAHVLTPRCAVALHPGPAAGAPGLPPGAPARRRRRCHPARRPAQPAAAHAGATSGSHDVAPPAGCHDRRGPAPRPRSRRLLGALAVRIVPAARRRASRCPAAAQAHRPDAPR